MVAVVEAVAAAGREEPVFNLILGNSEVFVAGDFLARGKPPADGGNPAAAAWEQRHGPEGDPPAR
jgi:hypothetical protein